METNVTPPCARALVVDDSEMDLMIARLAMKKFGFAEDIVTKKSARTALDYLAALEQTPELLPRLIFLDINMPELSGFDFLDEYEKLPPVIRQNCIILMLTSSMAHEDQARAVGNPFVCKFLNKPLDRAKLDSVRNEVLTPPAG